MFRESIIAKPVYSSNKRKAVRLILGSIEEHNVGKELNFNSLEVEHIMPEKLDKWWKEHLGGNWNIFHERWVDCLANLTLVISNKKKGSKQQKQHRGISPFCKSRDNITSGEDLELNKSLKGLTEWREEELKEKAEYLADTFPEIWPDIRKK